ncbi:metallophosphoesterase [Pseudomonas sp. B14-6]|uniref:metallophosphoesterase n=1 Tax=Pseudomonas sp. B14-6 TaxID=2738843 RepID=UPI00155E85D0|nr:metallophosphoesterase [Pseudomonas sp. B14-6]QKG67046.1 metallophosphoesterase [Pseudomonas sp. B14-6]
MKQRVLKLPRNDGGRDFVVGDIHFKTIDLHKALRALGFDSAVDRVIGVGDLIDRGPGVLDGLKLLGEPWFYTVLGNHEQMLIDAFRANPHAAYTSHGARWWMTIADDSKEMIIEKLEGLPVAIEVESARGMVGVVHADVPAGLSWKEFVGSLDNAQIEEVALWGRERVIKHYREGVSGVWRVCTGHTWIPQPLRLGNFLALDCTGGGEGPLAIFCIQDDTIYVEGRSVSLDSAETVTEQLQKLEEVLSKLKTEVNGNRLIESRGLSLEAEALVKQANSAWLSLRDEIAEPQRFINSLHGLSLLAGDRRAAKLEELKTRYEGTQIEQLLGRLLD